MPTERPSPSFGARRDGALPDLVLLHYTAMVDAEAALHRLCDPEIEVSAHYLIARDGKVFHLVDETQRAWHAGAGSWGAVQDVNSRSIGIELDNTGAQPFPEPQIVALEALLPGILARWTIPPERVIGHSDMAPTRKFDPGRKFDWRRLARGGLSIWPEAVGQADEALVADEALFRQQAALFGYPADVAPDTLLAAFRLRFRPWASGPLEVADLAVISRLAARYPVDLVGPNA